MGVVCVFNDIDGPCYGTLCRGMCSTHYQRERRHGDPLVKGHAAPGDGKRWIQSQLTSSRDRLVCWLDWPYAISEGGYPVCNGQAAGRVVLTLDGRPRPNDETNTMRHRCDVPRCLSPECLCWGTNEDNVLDMVLRGRQASGVRNRHAKLTDEAIRHIRRGDMSLPDLAILYDVSKRSIRNVRNRATWRHLP